REDTAHCKRRGERFLVTLGPAPKPPPDIIEDGPPFEAIAFDPDSVVKVALANRLDIQTRRDQIEDAERHLELQKTSFPPDLDLVASAGLNGSAKTFSQASPDHCRRPPA